MKLYGFSITPGPRRVRMFLAEKGIQVDIVDAVAADGVSLADWYIERYPHALTPMLELDDGTQIGEAMAICRYFEALQPDPPLMGADPKEKAIVEMWERRAYNEGMGAIEEVFRNSHPLMADRGLPGTRAAVPQIPALVERGMGRLRRFFDKLEHHLSANRYMAGERFSVADITTLCSLDFGRWCRLDIPEDCDAIRRWHTEVSARPSALA
jgi:glutathione S-transferase